jgi:hypothetical protein
MVEKNNGGVPARIGKRFHEEIEKIKDARLKNGKSKERPSTEKITNLIVRHKESWKYISNDIINAEEEDVNRYGLE